MTPTAAGEEILSTHSTIGGTIPPPARRRIWLAGMILVLAGWAVYSNSFGGVFTFDDKPSIERNASIQHGIWAALQLTTRGLTASARPLVNLSLALNYQLGGFNVWGYHVFNLAIQLLAGLTLFGLVRRTLERPVLRARYGVAALPLALVIALLWMVHPLQTESVTYTVQRAESMMGLFYLLTLYCFVRSVESPRAWAWRALSVLACLLGMFMKESMVTAPLLVLLYDRTFIAGTFAGAGRRWRYYAALAATWLPLVWLVTSVSLSANTLVINPSMDGLSPSRQSLVYALKQCEALVTYLKLSFWPYPLVLDYGNDVVDNPLDVAPQIVVLALLLGGTVYALRRKPALGFIGAWFFVILTPTSSVMPLKGQTMAEHHMYLSLAAIIVLIVLGLHEVLGRRAYLAGLALVLGLGGLTFERNHDYRTEISIWTDMALKRPDNERPFKGLAVVYRYYGHVQEAVALNERALRLNPDDGEVENDLGSALNALGRLEEARVHLLHSIALDPALPKPYANLGKTYAMLNEADKAREACLTALRIDPDFAPAHNNLGIIYAVLYGRTDQAIAEYEAALRTDPDYATARVNLANIFVKTNRVAEAISHYTMAIKSQPDDADAYAGLGYALYLSGRSSESIAQFDQALRLAPGNLGAHNNFGLALLQLGRFDDAARQFEETARLDPRYPNIQDNLTKARQHVIPSALPVK